MLVFMPPLRWNGGYIRLCSIAPSVFVPDGSLCCLGATRTHTACAHVLAEKYPCVSARPACRPLPPSLIPFGWHCPRDRAPRVSVQSSSSLHPSSWHPIRIQGQRPFQVARAGDEYVVARHPGVVRLTFLGQCRIHVDDAGAGPPRFIQGDPGIHRFPASPAEMIGGCVLAVTEGATFEKRSINGEIRKRRTGLRGAPRFVVRVSEPPRNQASGEYLP